MTTNSPNSFDGDVQALIEQCKENIDTLTVALKHCDQEEADEIYRNLELQKVSLAALTAEPVGWRDHESDSGVRWKQGEIFYGLTSHRDPLYTTPPAQVLRPVVLPKPINTHDLHGKTDYFYDRSEGWNSAIYECAESLRQQGYEVKND